MAVSAYLECSPVAIGGRRTGRRGFCMHRQPQLSYRATPASARDGGGEALDFFRSGKVVVPDFHTRLNLAFPDVKGLRTKAGKYASGGHCRKGTLLGQRVARNADTMEQQVAEKGLTWPPRCGEATALTSLLRTTSLWEGARVAVGDRNVDSLAAVERKSLRRREPIRVKTSMEWNPTGPVRRRRPPKRLAITDGIVFLPAPMR